MRRASGLLLTCSALLLSVPPASAAPGATVVLHVTGRGEGHGVGLALDSAEALARTGVGREAILNRFYPSTTRARVETTTLRVLVWEGRSSVTVETPYGGTVRADGHDWTLSPGERLLLSHDDLGYHLLRTRRAPVAPAPHSALRQGDPGASPSPAESPGPSPTGEPTPEASVNATPSPSATTSHSPAAAPDQINSASSLVLTPAAGGLLGVASTGRSYRGTLVFDASGGPALINDVPVEEYLQGVTAVPADWPATAQQAQAVAARTYALRALQKSTRNRYDLCSDARCQTYLGAGAESPRRTAAVRATRGEVVLFRGHLADAVYSTNAGGVTAAATEGLGDRADLPYLPAGRVAPGPIKPWTRDLDLVQVAHAIGYPGVVTSLSVSRRGPSGRVVEATVTGTAGTRTANGLVLASALNLPSTLYAVSMASGAGRALSPRVASTHIQAPPGQTTLPPVLAPPVVIAESPSSSSGPDLVPLAAEPSVSTDTPELRWVATTASALALLGAARRGRRRPRARHAQGS